MDSSRRAHLHHSGQCMRIGLDGVEDIAALGGNTTARSPAEVNTYTVVISACGKGWMALSTVQLFRGDATARSLADVGTFTAVVMAGWHRGPCGSLRQCDCKDSSPL